MFAATSLFVGGTRFAIYLALVDTFADCLFGAAMQTEGTLGNRHDGGSCSTQRTGVAPGFCCTAAQIFRQEAIEIDFIADTIDFIEFFGRS